MCPEPMQTHLAPGMRQPPVWPIAVLEPWQYENTESTDRPALPAPSLPVHVPDEPVSMGVPAQYDRATEFRLPPPPVGSGPGVWIPAGRTVEIAGLTVPGGMIYVGTSLKAANGGPEPCLINPAKGLAAKADYSVREFGYWPSYGEISHTARRAYLQWLAGGRSDPAAHIGYVFLFFYGLERRAIVDAAADKSVLADWPSINAEIHRLIEIYGAASPAFYHHASELMNWLSLGSLTAKLYERPLPVLPRTHQIPPYVRVALGQAATNGVPIPASFALAWAKLYPNIFFRFPATRCSSQFDLLFADCYVEKFKAGILIAKNKTKLKFVYVPASPGFQGRREIKIMFGDTPDVTVLTGPIGKLREIVESVSQRLEPYSRFLDRHPDDGESLEGITHLPPSVWPKAVLQTIAELAQRVRVAEVVMPLRELLANLGGGTALSRGRLAALGRALGLAGIGVEPDIQGSAKQPKLDQLIVLFTAPTDTDRGNTPAYDAALLTLQLASSVAWADGDFCAREKAHLSSQIQCWTHLTPGHQARLQAHLTLLQKVPASLATLKKRLAQLASPAKASIAAFLSTVAQADGSVSPAEVKLLGKLYKELGLDPKQVFGDLHALSSGTTPVQPANRSAARGFKLDPARIAALQRDTEKVSSLLADIFSEDPPSPSDRASELPQRIPVASLPASLLNLDEAHAAFATLLLSRPTWTLAELQDVAADLDLMLDGALERLNEAAFDSHDIPFTEGDDPIEVNAELRKKVDL